MTERSEGQVERPGVVEPGESGEFVTEPAKLMRIAAMTRAMLEEVRQTPLEEAGRRRLLEVHERTLDELREVLSEDLQEELQEIFLPLNDEAPSQGELRVAQAQLIGWLEGLFHGIQATLWSQQAVARSQLEEMRRKALQPGPDRGGHGTYL